MRSSQRSMFHGGRHFYISLVALVLTLSTVDGNAMALFDKKCLFSEVNGAVFAGGVPVAGAEVEQFYKWENSNKSSEKSIETDSNGRFRFDAILDNSVFTTILPSNPVIQQKIFIRYDGKEYEAYLFMKKNYDINGELDGKPLDLVCELDNRASREGGFYGVCTLANG